GSVVLGIKRETFDAELDAVKRRLGVASDPDVSPDELRKLTQWRKDIASARTGAPFPQDPREQLRLAIDAVFDSWFAKKATEYRRIHGMPADWGTAVTVMAMVFGNLGETSGTGVGFTRDPRTGERHFYAEFLANAQGEDVVAGIRTPESIDDLKRRMPAISDELLHTADPLARGGAVGHVVFNADRAVEAARNGQRVILVRPETSPEDVAGMYAAEGIVTARGGRTSHAAVVAVGMGKCCVVGANDIVVNEERRVFEAGGRTVREGDLISIDGDTGEVIMDTVRVMPPQLD